MALRTMLASRRPAIVGAWFAETLKSYPDATAQALARGGDRFRNPAGHLLRENLGALFDAVFLADDWPAAATLLGDIVRLRAVQGFTPEEAVGFLAGLRPILANTAGMEIEEFAPRIDRLGDMARAAYHACRLRIEEIRSNETRRRTWALERGRARNAP